jgi:hypothetical protein
MYHGRNCCQADPGTTPLIAPNSQLRCACAEPPRCTSGHQGVLCRQLDVQLGRHLCHVLYAKQGKAGCTTTSRTSLASTTAKTAVNAHSHMLRQVRIDLAQQSSTNTHANMRVLVPGPGAGVKGAISGVVPGCAVWRWALGRPRLRGDAVPCAPVLVRCQGPVPRPRARVKGACRAPPVVWSSRGGPWAAHAPCLLLPARRRCHPLRL